ncbi:uncharacterized protein NEMAJ01_0246 [Nematocida major]|uniref:uncharacterized protein n=1 Tax=Nematocida major TaxID=1912982 RepID=UPI002008C350|nr:uncharacterized protein NEMAJ01_0246 [Nematocida major]KAH9385350.1 hypothetical protein NEMAJ01_0246 [Nematocida major]
MKILGTAVFAWALLFFILATTFIGMQADKQEAIRIQCKTPAPSSSAQDSEYKTVCFLYDKNSPHPNPEPLGFLYETASTIKTNPNENCTKISGEIVDGAGLRKLVSPNSHRFFCLFSEKIVKQFSSLGMAELSCSITRESYVNTLKSVIPDILLETKPGDPPIAAKYAMVPKEYAYETLKLTSQACLDDSEYFGSMVNLIDELCENMDTHHNRTAAEQLQCVAAIPLVYEAFRENIFNKVLLVSSKYKSELRTLESMSDRTSAQISAIKLRIETYAFLRIFEVLNTVFDIIGKISMDILPQGRMTFFDTASQQRVFRSAVQNLIDPASPNSILIYPLEKRNWAIRLLISRKMLAKEMDMVVESPMDSIKEDIALMDTVLAGLKKKLGESQVTMELCQGLDELADMAPIFNGLAELRSKMNEYRASSIKMAGRYSRMASSACPENKTCTTNQSADLEIVKAQKKLYEEALHLPSSLSPSSNQGASCQKMDPGMAVFCVSMWVLCWCYHSIP